VTADPRLEHGLGDRHVEQVVLGRLEVTESLGEHRERPFDRGLDDDLVVQDGSGGLGHGCSSVWFSTMSL